MLFLFTHLTVERCPFLFIYLCCCAKGARPAHRCSQPASAPDRFPRLDSHKKASAQQTKPLLGQACSRTLDNGECMGHGARFGRWRSQKHRWWPSAGVSGGGRDLTLRADDLTSRGTTSPKDPSTTQPNNTKQPHPHDDSQVPQPVVGLGSTCRRKPVGRWGWVSSPHQPGGWAVREVGGGGWVVPSLSRAVRWVGWVGGSKPQTGREVGGWVGGSRSSCT